jgi:hypothetical protein
MAEFDEGTAVPGPVFDGPRFEPHMPSWSDVQKLSFEINSAARVAARALNDDNMALARKAAAEFADLDARKADLAGWLEAAQGV